MSVIKVKIQKDFVILFKGTLENPRLSFKAKGLWAYCMSRKDDWEFHVTHLATVSKEGVDAIYSALKELMDEGLVERNQEKKGKGEGQGRGTACPVEYIVYPYPQNFSNNFSQTDFPEAKESVPKNPALLSIEEESKDRSINQSSPTPSTPEPESNKVLNWVDRLIDEVSATPEEIEMANHRMKSSKERISNPKNWMKAVILDERERHKEIAAIEDVRMWEPTEEETQESIKRIMEIAHGNRQDKGR